MRQSINTVLLLIIMRHSLQPCAIPVRGTDTHGKMVACFLERVAPNWSATIYILFYIVGGQLKAVSSSGCSNRTGGQKHTSCRRDVGFVYHGFLRSHCEAGQGAALRATARQLEPASVAGGAAGQCTRGPPCVTVCEAPGRGPHRGVHAGCWPA